MPRLQFGSTWWGKKWLDALIATDYSNRLPRGVTYARNGSVVKLSMEGTVIRAKVQGSYPEPYTVKIKIPALKESQKKHIISLIEKHPFILSQLKQKKLPPELYDVFLKKHIHLFPRKWDELDADCSCPDWANCCKHIAAVIYLIANQIDQNPFKVLLLRGFDLLEALNEHRGEQEAPHVPIRKSPDIIEKHRKKHISHALTVNETTETMRAIDLSRIPDIADDVVSILPVTQVFCRHDDVRQILSKVYTILGRKRGWMEMEDDERSANTMHLQSLVLDDDLRIADLAITNGTKTMRLDQIGDREYFEQELLLRSYPLSSLPYIDPGMRGVILAYKITAKLAENGAFVPEIIEIAPETFRCRYVPFYLHRDVQAILTKATNLMPEACLDSVVKIQSSDSFLSKQVTCESLVSFFLGKMVKMASDAIPLSNDLVLRSLLYGEDLQIGRGITRDTVELVALYFSRFSIGGTACRPTIIIDESKSGFSLSLGSRQTNEDAEAVPMKTILSKAVHAHERDELLHIFGLLAEYCPEIAVALMTETLSVDIPDDRCVDLLLKILPMLRLLSIHTQLPRALQTLAKPRASVDIKKRADGKITSYLNLMEMLKFDWRVALGNHLITAAEMQSLLKTGRKLVKFRDTYVVLDPGDTETLLRNLARPPEAMSAARMLHTLLSNEWHGAPVSIDQALMREVEALFHETPVSLPKGLQAELRPYQERGFSWLYRNHRINFGSLLADDMGLGKTLQVITLLLKMKEENTLHTGSALVVAPTTLLTNWQREIEKFAPSLRTVIYHGIDRQLPEEPFDVLLTSYGLVRRDLTKFEKNEWAVTIFDEAQNVKNATTAQSKAVKSLKSRFKIAMTGTPVENSLMEYWNIADTVHPGYLGPPKAFKNSFAMPIEREQDAKVLSTFHAITKPLIIRRVKTDTSIISDLPKKVEQDAFATLTKEQAALYQSVVEATMAEIENSEGVERKGLIFKLMTALKQICNHPSHYQKSSTFKREQSGKMEHLFTLLETIRENHDKVLIFTQYTEMGKILEALIEKHTGRKPLFFHGGVSRTGRDELVQNFQNDPLRDILILSLKAGGVGLNLTAASHVVHYDLWWNPAVETQATDRAYRIGQKKNVFVHRFITQGTLEEKIDAMIKRKRALANLTVATGEKWIGELSNKELREIVRLERV